MKPVTITSIKEALKELSEAMEQAHTNNTEQHTEIIELLRKQCRVGGRVVTS